MSTFLWRSLLIISCGLAGMYLGLWAGATFFVPKNAGLAGGVMVLWYAILGALGFAIVGGFIAFRLQEEKLRKVALIIAGPVLLLYLVLTIMALMKAASEREPDSAFAPAGLFTVTMERVNNSDPYLFVKMEVDSQDRKWRQTGPAPEHKVCYANTMAKNLNDIRGALDNLLSLSAEKLADCDSADQPVIKRLHWNLIDERLPAGNSGLAINGSLEVNALCLQKHFDIKRVFLLIEKISLQAGGKVRCE